MKKLVFLFIIIFSLTGCFCSSQKEEIRKCVENAKKEMISYLNKYYGVNDVMDAKSEKSDNNYSCPSFNGIVSAKFKYNGKEYSILYTNGTIQDELTNNFFVVSVVMMLLKLFDIQIQHFNNLSNK